MGISKFAAAGNQKPSYWNQRSDAELVGYDFSAADPEKLDHLLQSVPETDEIPEVEFAYDTSAGGVGMVRCIHCKKVAKNHYRGFVLRFADGRRMLFGRNCGEKVYGAEFAYNKHEFQRALDRSDFLKRQDRIVQERARLIENLELIEADRSWKDFGDLKRRFVAAFPDLAADLAEAAGRRDGNLYAEVQVPDREGEAAYEERTGRKVQLFKRAQVVVHVLAGREFYLPIELPDVLVPQLIRRAKNTLWGIDEPERSNHDLALIFKGLSDIVAALRVQAARLDDLAAAFSVANVSGISRWLGGMSPAAGELRLAGSRLYRCNSKGEVREFLPRADSSVIRRAEIQLPAQMPSAPLTMIEEVGAGLQ